MLSRGESKKAISVLKEGLAKDPDSVLLNLLIGRAYLSSGNQNLALKHYDKVKQLSPRTAERYAAFFTSDTGKNQRASQPTEDFPLIWDSGD
jgi:cytochrome c-type biogenesis protein CcmH/NrfG